jgi:hypothetical protein
MEIVLFYRAALEHGNPQNNGRQERPSGVFLSIGLSIFFGFAL